MGVLLTKQDIEDLAVGAAILGTGGGGDPYVGKLMAIQAIERGEKILLVDADEIDNDAFVIPVAAMGTPTVLMEKIPSGKEALFALDLLEEYFNKRADYVTPIEAGGINSTIPLVVGAKRNIPIVDGDGMGRAFPELQQVSFHLYGIKATPMGMSDEKGNAVILDSIDNFWAEKLARAITIRMGGTAWIAIYAMSGKDFKRSAIRGTISLAIHIGRTLRDAKKSGRNLLDALLETVKGYELFVGKIINVYRENLRGFAQGEATIEGIDEYKGQTLEVKFQNENLIAIRDGEVIASVPDLITIFDKESLKPITTERLRYGLRVRVIGMPVSEKWRTKEGLEVVGPKYFGYDVEYKPIEKVFGGG